MDRIDEGTGIPGNNELTGWMQVSITYMDREYDKVYQLRVEGFKDTDGNIMAPQEIWIISFVPREANNKA